MYKRFRMEVIDLSYVKSVADGDEELFKSLIEIFKEQLSEYREGLNKLYDEEDWHGMALLAHKAKSSILSMGMTELGEAMKKLEMLCKYICVQLQSVDLQTAERFSEQLDSAPEYVRLWVSDNNSKKNIQDLIFFYILQSEKAKSDLKELHY